MSKSLVAALAFVLILSSGGVAHALSCSGKQQVAIATRLDRPLPRLASMVVYVSQGKAPRLQLERKGQRAVKMRSTRIAPGLYRYAVGASLAAGAYRLTTNSATQIRNWDSSLVLTKGKGVVVSLADTAPKVEPVPAVKAVHFTSRPGGMWSPKVVYNLAFVFKKALPPRFVAVVGAWHGKNPSVSRKPSAGRLILPASTQITAFATPVRCGRLPEKAVSPKDNARASLALVDEFGSLHLLGRSHKLHLVPGV